MRELKKNWLDLFQLFRVSLHMPKLFLSAVGLLLSLVAIGGVTFLVGDSGIIYDGLNEWQEYASGRHLIGDIHFESVYLLVAYPFAVTYFASKQLLTEGSTLQIILWSVLSGSFFLLIWSYFGTAISRLAAVEITRDERIESSEACGFAWDRFLSTLMSFVLPIIGFVFFGAVISFVSLLINVPVLNILVMFALPLALVGGFVMALIGIGTAGGFPLFTPSIAVEGTDSFDAISRGFSYVLSRVWSYLWYVLVSAGYGVVCSAFVLGFSFLLLLLTNGAGVIATEPLWFPFQDTINLMLGDYSWHIQATGVVYYSWVLLFQFLVVGFLVSFYFSSSTLIYLLMRKQVDGIDMEEVYEELDEDEDLLFEDESFEEGFDEDDEQEEDDTVDSDSNTEEEDDQEEFDCTEPDCDRSFDTEFGRDQHHRLVHQDDE